MTLLDNLLKEITPEEQARTDQKMRIAAIIGETLLLKKISKKDFAHKVGRRQSEITKWLSGTHNFTIDTLTDIEQVLNIKLIADKRKSSSTNQTINGMRT